MTHPETSDALFLAEQPGHPPDTVRPVLCIYCRTETLVYRPPDSRLPSASCPGCQRQEPARRGIVASRLTVQANDRRPGHAHAGTPGQLD
jgi:hypothetical protein